MNRGPFALLGVTAALIVAAGCNHDPLSDLDGKPSAIVKQFSQMHVAIGGSATFTASVVDGRLTPLTDPVTFSASGANFTVVNDDTYDPPTPTSFRAKVTGTSAGTGYAIIQGANLRDSVTIIVP
jgi:hypothetical protein